MHPSQRCDSHKWSHLSIRVGVPMLGMLIMCSVPRYRQLAPESWETRADGPLESQTTRVWCVGTQSNTKNTRNPTPSLGRNHRGFPRIAGLICPFSLFFKHDTVSFTVYHPQSWHVSPLIIASLTRPSHLCMCAFTQVMRIHSLEHVVTHDGPRLPLSGWLRLTFILFTPTIRLSSSNNHLLVTFYTHDNLII